MLNWQLSKCDKGNTFEIWRLLARVCVTDAAISDFSIVKTLFFLM